MNSGRKRNTSLGAAQVAERDPTALAHAVELIFRTCCLAGAPSVIADILDEDELNAIGEHDTAALFNMLVIAFSYQGTSDVVAHDYMQRHGTPTWRGIESELSRGSGPSCDKLASYWQFSQCRYLAVMTPGVAALGQQAVERIVQTISVFDDFCNANDPHEEHDFGAFKADGRTVF
ncbi:MAG TPA: DUF3768 domain-containing protein, partial [Candidatus Sulfotelmatobacter sp.]